MEALNDPNPIEASRRTMEESWIFLWIALCMFVTTAMNVGFFELCAARKLAQFIVPLA
eukprot:SAG11_NODE_9709_length_887_cov_1.668782_1_plen_57_part_10